MSILFICSFMYEQPDEKTALSSLVKYSKTLDGYRAVEKQGVPERYIFWICETYSVSKTKPFQ